MYPRCIKQCFKVLHHYIPTVEQDLSNHSLVYCQASQHLLGHVHSTHV
jgi:hypothetical protein